jgi:hypothetical protein
MAANVTGEVEREDQSHLTLWRLQNAAFFSIRAVSATLVHFMECKKLPRLGSKTRRI